MKPERAIEEARERAARRIAGGGYREPEVPLELRQEEGLTRERLMRYALIDVDAELVYSTRRGVVGRTITRVKRGLLRSLRQYHAEQQAQQTHFNLHMVSYATTLERRIEALEAELRAHR